ncbi:MAG: MarR family transcriptional regulator [Burkholderiaceae bacterium]
MPARPLPPPPDRTPSARLAEGPLRGLVGYQLALATIVTDQVFDDRAGRELRRVEFTILALVHANPDVTARQLARALAVTPPNIALWLERLVSRKLVARTRSPHDARMQHLRLTRSGAALVERTMAALVEAEQATLEAHMSAAERAMLAELLHKAAMARRRAEPG